VESGVVGGSGVGKGVIGCRLEGIVSFDEIIHSPQSSNADSVVGTNEESKTAVVVGAVPVAAGWTFGSSASSPITRSFVCSESVY
jgi:hypothetical protein